MVFQTLGRAGRLGYKDYGKGIVLVRSERMRRSTEDKFFDYSYDNKARPIYHSIESKFGDYDYQVAYEKTLKIIKRIPSVTAFLIGGFEMAPACLRAVKDSGLKVPDDISIICYIDNDIMPLLDPSITAIKWPYYEMGKKAAMMLLEKGADKKKYIFETELVIRHSTTCNRHTTKI